MIIFTLFLCFGKKLLPLLFAYLVKQEQKNNREKREIGITDLRNEPEFARRTSNDQSIQELLGIGLGLLVVISAIVYGILFLRLWAYECLLNGSKSVSSFILNFLEIVFK